MSWLDSLRNGGLTALLVAGLSGCTVTQLADRSLVSQLQKSSPSEASPNGASTATDDSKNGKNGENGKENSKPGPRTLPQAVATYIRKLPYCCCTAAGGKEDTANEKNNHKAEQMKEAGLKDSTREDGKTKKNDIENPEGVNADQKEAETGGEKEEKKNDEKAKEEEKSPAWYSAHAQATIVTQEHNKFRSPYVGANSLVPDEPPATSMTGTVFLDFRLWELGAYSGELVFNPEIAGGRGFSNSSGIAGFPNGEITRVGVPEPTPYIARLFARQTWGFGGEQEKVEEGPNQIAGLRDVNRFTFSIGKMSATDIVDDNRYSHDPRTQFLPWSIMYNGAWDYPANVRGYTYGIAMDYNTKYWALRYGVFAEPATANGAPLDPHFLKANGQVLELEQRYTFFDHPGKLRLLGYLNRAHMGKYADALDQMPVNPDVTLTRDYRIKYGFGMSWEQKLTKNLGVFARLGWDDGQSESWAFTAIDQLALLGILLNGRCWCRPNDQIGLAIEANGLADVHHAYLAAGGLDFIIGDGKLHYAPEEILEVFYNLQIIKGINLTADFQAVNNPAFNQDRGPVAIGSIRVHFEF